MQARQFVEPRERYFLIQNQQGLFAGVEDQTIVWRDDLQDEVLWSVDDASVDGAHSTSHAASANTYQHMLTGQSLPIHLQDSIRVIRGPDRAFGELSSHFAQHGWVCLPALIDPTVLDGLQSLASQLHEQGELVASNILYMQACVAQASVEPISLWLVRQYLSSSALRFAHVPTMLSLDPDDGQADVQGWHTDYPYLYGISDLDPKSANVIEGAAPQAVQKNICVTDFSADNGATVFQLGSHTWKHFLPRDWGWQVDYMNAGHRRRAGLPLTPENSSVIEAPAGSVLLYDARLWHRAGVNQSDHVRTGMLQAITSASTPAFRSTQDALAQLQACDFYAGLTLTDKRTLSRLLDHADP